MGRKKIDFRHIVALALFAAAALLSDGAAAHHILGRPAYNLNEDSNTPPSMQAEIQVGDHLVTYMIFPAFPRPGDPARINLYVLGPDSDNPYSGKVAFKVRAASWFAWLGFAGQEDELGVQSLDDKVYRQRFVIAEAGDYLVSATLTIGGERHVIDFPLRVGEGPAVGPFTLALALIVVVLIAVAVLRRRQSATAKIRAARPRRG